MSAALDRRGSAALTCEVAVDRQPLADTGADYLSGVPTVLTGLRLTWGRQSINEQPATATAGLTVRDRNGGAEFLSLLHVGRMLTVWAQGELATGGDPTDVAVDGEFADWTIPVRDRVTVAGGTGVYGDFGNGNTHVRVTQTSFAPWWCRVFIPPAPFSANATAWDDIPAAMPGQAWRIELGVIAGRAAGARVQACIFAHPNERNITNAFGPQVAVDFEALQTAVVEIVIPDDAPRGWLGFRVDLTMREWQNTPRTWEESEGFWAEWPSIVLNHFRVYAPAVAPRRVLAFTGRITDLVAEPHDHGGVEVAITAADTSADLANVYVGDLAWNAERLDLRAQRVVTLSGVDVDLLVDPHPASARVTWRDVDSQPVWGLLSELADSADAVLWCAEHATRDAYLWMEDQNARESLSTLAFSAADRLVILTTATDSPGGRGVVVSACDLDRDVQWSSSVSEVITRVDLTWNEQTVDEEGKPAPTERHVLVVDPDAERQFGQRRAGYTTQLADVAFAEDVADRVLSRSRTAYWHTDSVLWDTDVPRAFSDSDRRSALDLLDGTRRIGMPLTITELPDIAPGQPLTRYHVEGGSWTFDRGRWLFDMSLSPSTATGDSVTWRDLDPAWAWSLIDARPATVITWWDMWGVGAENLSLSWRDTPGTWNEQSGTWDDRWGPHGRQREAA